MDKTAYVSPPLAELNLTLIRDANPVIVICLDVGLPNYLPHFEIKMPFPEGKASQVAKVVREALGALLDEVLAFMQSMGYSREAQVQLYADALTCFGTLGDAAEAERMYPEYVRDSVIKTYEGTFRMPKEFVDETQKRVVTAATVVKRYPEVRRLELAKVPPPKVKPSEVEKLIHLYQARTLKTQPHQMYVMVYDQFGHPAGVVPQSRWKSTLLGSKKPWQMPEWMREELKRPEMKTGFPAFILPNGQEVSTARSHNDWTDLLYPGRSKKWKNTVDRFLNESGAVRVMYPEFDNERYAMLEAWTRPTPEQIQRFADAARRGVPEARGHVVWDFHVGSKIVHGEGSIGALQRAIEKAWSSKTSSTIGEGHLLEPLLGTDGKLYEKGHRVKVDPMGTHRVEIKDAATGIQIAKINLKELDRVAN